MNGQDAELELLKGVSCAAVLEQLPPPWRLDRRESTRGALKYRRGKGEVLIVSHQGKGWWDPMSDARGGVIGLVQHLAPGLNLGQVRRVLRPFVAVAPSYPEYLREANDTTADRSVQERWESRPRLRRGSDGWAYLALQRCLPASVLQLAADMDCVREGYRGSVWFAHRRDGTVTHVEVRGPAFRGSLKRGAKTLFRFAAVSGSPPRRLAIAEAPIDALSLAAIEGVRPDTLYLAAGGGMGPPTIAALETACGDLAARGGGTVASGADSDHAGERYAARHAALAAAAGLAFERAAPPAGDDWNGALRARAGRS